MQMYNGIGLRETLEQMETSRLDEMLQTELEKESPDSDSVRLILSVLEEREADEPLELTPGEEAAWKRYQERMASRKKKPLQLRRWAVIAASAALIVGMLFTVIPQQAEAETFWEMLQRWSSAVLVFFSGEGKKAELEYVFSTDNPGLQQVYDAVVELGVTEPVVPMWLPDGFNLIECQIKRTPMMTDVWAWFICDNNELVYKVNVYDGEPAHQYYKDDSHYETYERNGSFFNITRNVDCWVVVWTKDNIECSISIDCQEDTLWRILESIYVMEDN